MQDSKRDTKKRVSTDQDKRRFKTDDADSYNAVIKHFDRYTQRFTAHLPAPLLAMVRKKALLKGLQGRTEFLKMDAENLAFPDNSFDAAISLYALHHFPSPGKALSEIYRVLKPGASVIVAVGSSPPVLSMAGVKAVARRFGSNWRRSMGRELSACDLIDALIEKHIPKKTDRDVTEWAEQLHTFTGSVKNMVTAAGFTNIRHDWKGQYSTLNDVDDFWLLQMTFSSTARKRVQQADDGILERLKTEFYQRSEQVLKKNGRLVYQTGAAIIAGIKPTR